MFSRRRASGAAADRKRAYILSGYFVYYTEANIICLIIFGVMLIHDLLNAAKQETQIKFDHTLIAFMLYFISDTVWAAVIAGVIPLTTFSVVAPNFTNNLFMAYITYCWLRYVMAVEQVPNRENRRTLFVIIFPFLAAMIVLVAIYLIAPQLLLTEALELTNTFFFIFLAVPFAYIVAIIVYAMRKARHEENPAEKKKHLFIGFFPLMVIAVGLIQLTVLPDLPLFCFASTILMLVFYIKSMERQISIDPLTGLNNRGQLLRYISLRANAHPEGRPTFVMMIDVNDFKTINDSYGHAEGDRALILIADALKRTIDSFNQRSFLARYGGDEFILILHPTEERTVEQMADTLRVQTRAAGAAAGAPFTLAVSLGYDALGDERDTYQKCIQRADNKLYLDKERGKRENVRKTMA